MNSIAIHTEKDIEMLIDLLIKNNMRIYCDHENSIVISEAENYEVVANNILKYLTRQYEDTIIFEYLEKAYPDLTIEDKIDIFYHAKNVIADMADELGEILYQKILFYLSENKQIHTNGIYRFGMKEYKEAIYRIIDDCFSFFLFESEMDDYISLIKFYVDTEPREVGTLHILVDKNQPFKFYNEDYQEVTQELYNRFFGADGCCEENDLMLSILLGLNPEEIIVHGGFQNFDHKIWNTIHLIFTDRLKTCEGCNLCNKTVRE